VTKVKEFQVETIVDTLCTNMISEKEQLKDISSIGLKTVINQLPSVSTQISTSIVKKITGRLLSTIQKVIKLHKKIFISKILILK
jgi:cullin-associated NEDD8-dissociated protein 1